MSAWMWPTDMPVSQRVITSHFQEQRTGYKHEGVDLRGYLGYHVLAPCSGRIARVNIWDGSLIGFQNYGNYVVLIPDDAPQRQIFLCHMARLIVTEGVHVRTGDNVGIIGATGNTQGAHLHLHITDPQGIPSVLGQKVINPTPFIMETTMPTKSLYPLHLHIQRGSAYSDLQAMSAQGKVPAWAKLFAAIHCREVKEATQGVTKTILRIQELSEQGEWLDNGEAGGRAFVQACKARSGGDWVHVDALEFVNEQGGHDPVRLAQINTASLGFVAECAREGKSPLVGGFSVGEPSPGQMVIVLPCIRAALAVNGYYSEHDYGPRALFDQSHLYVECWRAHVAELAANGLIVPTGRILITEFGHDWLSSYRDAQGNNTSGAYRALGISLAQLQSEYSEYARRAWLAGLGGVFLYNCWGFEDQMDYELMELNNNMREWYKTQVATWVAPIPPPPPPPLPDVLYISAPTFANLRSAPRIEPATDIGDIYRGASVAIIERAGEWYKVRVVGATANGKRLEIVGWLHQSVVSPTNPG